MNRILISIVMLVTLASAVFATDGYFSHGYGTQSKGIGGAGVALPLSSLSAVTNPAASVFMEKRFDIGFAIFNPNRQYTVVGNPSGAPGTFGLTPGTVKSDSKVFFIPHFALNWALDDRQHINVAAFGNGGMNTDYGTATFYDPNSSTTGVNLSQLFFSMTYARKINNDHGLGITLIGSVQIFEAKGMTSFGNFSRDAQHLTNNKNDFSLGYGARIGYLGNILPKLSIGASFQTKIYMAELNDYKGLFAQQGDFDIPANWTVGLAYKATDKLTLVGDVQHIYYSDIKSVGNKMNPANFQQGIMLGDDNGSGFGWRDMTIYKAGVQVQKGGGWTWRGGYSYGKQPIPSSEVMFNILAPGVIEQHVTFGFSKKVNHDHEISFAATHAFSKEVKGANPMEAPGQQTIKLKMNQWDFEVSYSF